MNEPDFEEQLRALRPAAPHRSLEERIARDIAGPILEYSGRLQRAPRTWLERLLPALGWCATGAAAAVITMLLLNLFDGHIKDIGSGNTVDLKKPVQPVEILPVSTQGEILAASDEGIHESAGESPMRVVRYESLERRQWTDETGAVTIVEVPREDIFRVPVSFQ